MNRFLINSVNLTGFTILQNILECRKKTALANKKYIFKKISTV